MIELRALTPDDWAIWRELRLAALAEAPDAFGDVLGQDVERWARGVRAGVVRLDVAQGNEHAEARLYRRNGFTHTGELGDLMPDGVRREHVMGKVLSD